MKYFNYTLNSELTNKNFYKFFGKDPRKPDEEIFATIIHNHDLSPKRTLFVDDKKVNTDAAASLGLHVWNLKVGEEDVIDLFEQKHLPL